MNMLQQQPLIGITTNGRWEDYYKLRIEYVDSVRRAKGIPVMLPPGEFQLDELLARLDGVVFSGGLDVDPKLYQGVDHETLSRIDVERDEFEMKLAQKVLKLRLPSLFICRGIQVLNVALGRGLIEHLPDEVNGKVIHRATPPNPVPHHITLNSSSRLAEIMGQTETTSASWHHQAIRQLAQGAQVAAHAADGTIEAVEFAQYPWLVAVQWHPELTAGNDPTQQRLFNWLIETAATNKNGS